MKEHSVFDKWKPDTDYSLEQAFKADAPNWKLHRFVKDGDGVGPTEKLLKDNFAALKKIFTIEAARSGYPCITWIKYSDFCHECDLVGPGLPLATVDRLFIATNVELTKHEENPATALQRFEFLEILTRVAQAKFKDTGVCATTSEALQKLLDEHVLKHGGKPAW